MNEVMIGDPENGDSCLQFSGELVFENIQRIKEQVDSILSNWKGKELNITISDVRSFDLSFLQLLETVANHLLKQETELNVEWEMDEETRLLLENTGFEKYT